MPCLDECGTVGGCTDEALSFMARHDLSGEVIVADNGSTDGSAYIAAKHGAVVINVRKKGYGRAVRAGIRHSRGAVIIIADSDSTYDLAALESFYYPLAQSRADVMIGDRFAGGIEPGAMPLVHIPGILMLSALGNIFFSTDIHDHHCGIRALTRRAASVMQTRTTGMEFAAEFIAEAKRRRLRIGETPAVLRKCRSGRRSKLRTFRDGMRHLIYIIGSGK
ncbi:MAG: glycosyltransferase family 2 protein [Oscillospiraceae bacterium]|nr:glycosyltransferase family 2 protein [Oscillospiraceae bacterium]